MPLPIKRRTIVLLFALGLAFAIMPRSLMAQSPLDPSLARQQVQQGVDQYQSSDFQAAIVSWQTALATYRSNEDRRNQAIVAENLARAHRRLGDDATALGYWQETAQLYSQLARPVKLGRILTEQAQTYTSLGQYRQAGGLLCGMASSGTLNDQNSCTATSAVGLARTEGDPLGAAAALGSLGEVYRLQGRVEWAEEALASSLEQAAVARQPSYTASANLGLGSLYLQKARASDRRAKDAQLRGDNATAATLQQQAEADNQTAITYFQKSLAAAGSPGQVRSLLNLIPAYHRAQDLTAAQSSYQQALSLLGGLPPSRDKAYATIDLANLLPLTLSLDIPRESLSGSVCLPVHLTTQTREQLGTQIRTQTEALLMAAIATAEVTEDYRAQSFAYGKLGHLYECDRRYEEALSFTKDAEWAADQALKSYDSLYLWQWQTGRILRQQSENQAAIAAYDAAVTTLKKIRSDILTAERDLQFDFRDAVEPVYRELAELRLAQAPSSQMVVPNDDDNTAGNIGAALTTIDALRLAELQNYFGDECLILASVDAEDADEAAVASYPGTGIFSTFITDERTAVVLTLPNGQRRVEWLSQGQAAINETANDFRRSLEVSLSFGDDYDPNVPGPNQFNPAFNPSLSATLYDDLIRPFAADLTAAEISTLVFVQDGIFRSIPMAALYDGEHYLIEEYAIATTPSLSLTPVAPPPRRRLRALALGLSEPATVGGKTFEALEGVGIELDQIQQQLPGSRQLLNEKFTEASLRQALQEEDYSIIHMATHGEFGAEPQDTFLVTGDKEKLTIGALEQALRSSGGGQQVDILTLTACKTAVGDTRATLGLAGVAVQAGARSAVASLWSINDLSTATIVNSFYKALKRPELSKAEALQEAQVSALRSNNPALSKPGFWAPFLLIGDWQ